MYYIRRSSINAWTKKRNVSKIYKIVQIAQYVCVCRVTTIYIINIHFCVIIFYDTHLIIYKIFSNFKKLKESGWTFKNKRAAIFLIKSASRCCVIWLVWGAIDVIWRALSLWHLGYLNVINLIAMVILTVYLRMLKALIQGVHNFKGRKNV